MTIPLAALPASSMHQCQAARHHQPTRHVGRIPPPNWEGSLPSRSFVGCIPQCPRQSTYITSHLFKKTSVVKRVTQANSDENILGLVPQTQLWTRGTPAFPDATRSFRKCTRPGRHRWDWIGLDWIGGGRQPAPHRSEVVKTPKLPTQSRSSLH